MKIGFIQGRLSPITDGMIQAFPWTHWEEEFPIASSIGLHLLEWTLDQEKIYENPFMNTKGHDRIKELMSKYSITIPSLTGDCFMQSPFYKAKSKDEKKILLKCLDDIIISCSELGVRFIVIPLVDNGSIDNLEQREVLMEELLSRQELLKNKNVSIVFESDLPPLELKEFIGLFPIDIFGINYDSGNSAALGYNVEEEFSAYQDRIQNIHIKDRLLGGTTVSLGSGNTNFESLFSCVKIAGYSGNLILQTARADDEKHKSLLKRYRDFVIDGMKSE